MPLEGYIRKRPDGEWWLDQIRQGELFRKNFASEDRWPEWRAMYRGDWDPGIMPVNLFFTMLRTTVPRIYFRDPRVSIMPGKPGFLNMAFARILERADNKLLRQMKIKKHMKRIVQQTFLLGTSFGKLGFGSIHTPVPLDEADPIGKSGELLEFNFDLNPDMPWFSAVHPSTVIVPNMLGEFEHSRWIAHYILRPVEDVRADPRFTNTNGIKPTRKFQTPTNHRIDMRDNLVELYEVRDKKTGKTFVLAPSKQGSDKTIFFDDDRMLLYGGFPFYPSIYNDDDEVFWGIPDAKILEPYQLEINEIKTQIMKHRRLTLVKIIVKEKGMTPDEAEKLVSQDVSAVAFIKGSPVNDVRLITGSTIPQELFVAAESVTRDVRESLGFSRNQFGEFNSRTADTTATEANIVQAASEIRVDERRDMMADMLVDIIESVHQIIFDLWGNEQVVDVIGPGGVPVWVAFKGQQLRSGAFAVNIDPDSGVPETRQVREQRAMTLYQLLVSNPLIDPIKLTQHLLAEFKGTAFDDMMRIIPAAPGIGGNSPGNPLQPEQFANFLGQSFALANSQGLSQPTLPAPQPSNAPTQLQGGIISQ
jgi:hypothetical protein